MPLTAIQVQNAKPDSRTRKLFDGRGLFLEVTPKGGKRWRLKYRFHRKEKLLSLGVYPDISLKEARQRRDAARNLLAHDVDPSAARKAERAAQADRSANSFEVVAREWLAKHGANWVPAYRERQVRLFERDLFPWLGGRPIAEIDAMEMLDTAQRIEARGALETAHRALQTCGQVFRYAVRTGRAERNPTGDLRGALPAYKGKHRAALIDPVKVGALLRAIDGYQGSLIVRAALRLAPLVFQRPGELRQAAWEDMDLQNAKVGVHGQQDRQGTHRTTRPAGGRNASGRRAADRTRPLRVPERPLAPRRPADERQRAAGGPTQHGLRQGRDVRTRLPGARADTPGRGARLPHRLH